MRDIRQTSEYASYLRDIGWRVEKIGGNFIFIKHFPILGNFIKIQRPEKINKKNFEEIEKKYKPFRILYEPKDKQQLSVADNLKFKKTSAYLPTKTFVLDLKKSKEEILMGMRKSTRQTINKIQMTNVKLLKSEDVRSFRKSWKRAVGIRRYVTGERDLSALKKNFGRHALLLIEVEGNSGAIFLRTNDVGYYWQAFTNKKGRKENMQYKILWEGIKWAKKNGCSEFDFEGIYDKRFPNKKWKGFSFFKKGFGGKEKIYPGGFVWKKRRGLTSDYL